MVGRLALDQREVVRGEKDDAEGSQQISWTPQRAPVQGRLVGATCVDLDLEQQLPRIVDAGLDASACHGSLGPGPDQGRVDGDPHGDDAITWWRRAHAAGSDRALPALRAHGIEVEKRPTSDA